jgi:hypothetical protein
MPHKSVVSLHCECLIPLQSAILHNGAWPTTCHLPTYPDWSRWEQASVVSLESTVAEFTIRDCDDVFRMGLKRPPTQGRDSWVSPKGGGGGT